MVKELMRKVENEYQRNLVLNEVGRWIYYQQTFNNEKDIWYKVSESNRRLTSLFTNLPKWIRNYVEGNGKVLYGIDIKSSQPYILSTIINNSFILTRETYSLYNIYPELYKERNIMEIKQHDSQRRTKSSYMCAAKLNQEDFDSIENYTRSPFSDDFYLYLVNFQGNESETLTRETLKRSFMYILFQENTGHRNNDKSIQFFKQSFPGVAKWIEWIHRSVGAKKFAYLLQRTESYLILEKAGLDFLGQYPKAPLFSIHDCLYTDELHIDGIEEIIKMSLLNETGIPAGTKKTSVIDFEESRTITVDKVWKEVGKLKDEKQYRRVQNTVFPYNLALAEDYLKSLQWACN